LEVWSLLIEVMPQGAAVAEANRRAHSLGGSLLTALARSLTVLRLLAVAPFVWLFVAAAESADARAAAALAGFYVAVALSDLIDGKLARLAGAASPRWGRMDVAADMTFNLASLTCAAALGRIGFWVPASVALLGGRFLLRLLGTRRSAAIAYDRAGNLAGVLYYLLVGAIVFDQWLGIPGGWLVARAADGVFLYTVYALSAGSLRKSSA
jgi:phosphatidylglycerophosphate synthase